MAVVGFLVYRKREEALCCDILCFQVGWVFYVNIVIRRGRTLLVIY